MQKIGHYSKVCKSAKLMWQTQQIKPQTTSPQQTFPQTRRVRNIRPAHEQQQEEQQLQDTRTEATDGTLDLENTFYIQEVFDSWNTVNLIHPKNFVHAHPQKLSPNISDEIWIKTSTDTFETNWLADTGSPRSFICKTEAERIIQMCKSAKWKEPTNGQTQYRCFNNIEIPITGIIQINLRSGLREATNNEILVVNANTVNLMGRDILGNLGFTLSQNKGTNINNINMDNRLEIKIIKKFPHLCSRLGKSKNHIAKSTLKQDISPYQHKSRRVPLHLTEKFDKEIQHLLNTNQIIKLEKCSDQVFISPVVITVKHDQSIKLALDSKLLNDAIDKNKYQMQSIDNLMDSVAKYISDNKNKQGNFLFSKVDLKYAYSQIPLHPEIRKHCNFNILGGKSSGTYQFINGFYGLSDMPATFQKTLDKTLENIDNKFNFLDDILIITKGSILDHELDIYKVLSRLDNENLAIKLEKCELAKSSITWLGYKIPQSGISPTVKKTDSIMNLKPPNTLKQLRSLMGSIHQLIKFIPNLASLLNPIRPLLKKENITNNKIRWEERHTTALDKIKAEISKIKEKKHFDKQRKTRLKCDASHTGLGAVLEQQYPEGWFPIAYASRFLNEAEMKYSTNELELLSVVWATNHFKYYLLGSKFELITDHTALLSALKPNRANKSRQSRLIRWVDKLLPYTFSIQHIPGKDMGFTDYLSRNPHQKPPPISPDDELFVINRIREFTFTLLNEERKHNILTNQIAPFGLTRKSHDVTNNAQCEQKKANAFCHFSCHKQSHSFSLVNSNSRSNPKFQSSPRKTISNLKNIKNYSNPNYSNFPNKQQTPLLINPNNYYLQCNPKINVVTRNRPNLNTFDRQIIKRARRPKTNTMSHKNLNNPPPKTLQSQWQPKRTKHPQPRT